MFYAGEVLWLLKLYDGKANIFESTAKFALETINANTEYRLDINFDSVKLEQLDSHVKFVIEAMNVVHDEQNQDKTDENAEHVNFFSLIGDGKKLLIDIKSKELTMQNATYFENFVANVLVSKNDILFKKIEMQTPGGLLFNADGVFKNINESNRFGIFTLNASGIADPYNIAQKIIEYITLIPLSKTLTPEEKIDLSFGIYLKGSSFILHDLNLKIQDVMHVVGHVQHKKVIAGKEAKIYNMHNIEYSDVDFAYLKTNFLNFSEGSTLFQEVIKHGNVSSEKKYHFINSKIGKNLIQNSTITMISHDNTAQFGFEVDSSEYNLAGSMSIDVRKQQPIFMADVTLNNVTNFDALQSNLKQFFGKNYVFLPSLAKFDGSVNFFVYNSQIFGEQIENISLQGVLKNGVATFAETIFSAKDTDTLIKFMKTLEYDSSTYFFKVKKDKNSSQLPV
jgi:hypothetical protein